MPWNPEIYNKFKDIRYRPFWDLAALISPGAIATAIDIGCGTGEQTALLADKFEGAVFLGTDSSVEMLTKSKQFESDRVHFEKTTTEAVAASRKQWDLVFSNAALQWSDGHENLFLQLISLVSAGGQFAIQLPVQPDNILNQLLLQLVQEEPFITYLQGWKRDSPVLGMDEYAQLMFDSGLQDIQVIKKVYPIVADNHETLFDFIAGSALIPYMERLQKEEKDLFISTYKKRIAAAFLKLPALYAFKRLLLYGRK